MEDMTLSHQQSEKHLDQGDMASSAFDNRDNLYSQVSTNLLGVRQSYYSWSWYSHNIKRSDRNMRRRVIDVFCKQRRLLLWKNTTISSL
jgi:hypothetical protein